MDEQWTDGMYYSDLSWDNKIWGSRVNAALGWKLKDRSHSLIGDQERGDR